MGSSHSGHLPGNARACSARLGKSQPAGHPLGPYVTLARVAHPVWGRCYAAAVGLMAAGVLLVAWRLTPANQPACPAPPAE